MARGLMTSSGEAPYFKILVCLFRERLPAGPAHLMPSTQRELGKYLQNDCAPVCPPGLPGPVTTDQRCGVKGCD